MTPQPWPVLDRSLMRRAEAGINFISGVAIGSFLYWFGKVVLLAYLAGRLAAAFGGKQ